MSEQNYGSAHPRDHGGGIDSAAGRWGGTRADWLDLSTGINPQPYPMPPLPADAWTALPDSRAERALVEAARAFWEVPEGLDILPCPGASAAIARLPALGTLGRVWIPQPTYNEHAASFGAAGWSVSAEADPAPDASVLVHPNNPDGRLWTGDALPSSGLLVIDESFCDVCPERTLISVATERPGTLILKSFGKFWGLAGVRLGFVIAAPDLIAPLRDMIGPWAVSGPALTIGTEALRDVTWAEATRARLERDATRLDALLERAGARTVGGTPLFRLYDTADARAMQDRLAAARIWTRIFPYSDRWLRLGLPGGEPDWQRLEAVLA
ncbi:threonine-phosphate decarboxylase CobD [Tropicimonas isoalkanivorans]|uniref:threonine-phosphate decarboxylase n=1 Tax=Tropicimonas isoalkanivorans TaxID=441112 RepID=A0A1I1P9X5_9RHOB|nr:threonine-phosphate decarboxylase CobD [Tropicimonas isoalkanivorans]SFD06704.1 L-threonine O-3-phosphate decarboxylase [Tropicimonas isoalkanivorans]